MLGLEYCKLYSESVGAWDIPSGFVNWEDQLSAVVYSKYVINVLRVDRQSKRVRSLSQGREAKKQDPKPQFHMALTQVPRQQLYSGESLQNDCPLVRLMGM